MAWQLQDAKNRLSEVLREAEASGPQVITVRGREAVVVMSVRDFRRLSSRKGSLVSFLQSSPWADVELDLQRLGDPGRDVPL